MKYPNCEKDCKHRYLQFHLRGADFRCNVTGTKLKMDYEENAGGDFLEG